MTKPKRRPKLTKARVEQLLRDAAPGANELLKKLEECYRLPPESWNLRLR
jgi:hypothetical protein